MHPPSNPGAVSGSFPAAIIRAEFEAEAGRALATSIEDHFTRDLTADEWRALTRDLSAFGLAPVAREIVGRMAAV